MPPDTSGSDPRLFFYVQHLLGIGHVHRAARIAKALADDGFEVVVALGGLVHDSLDFGAARTVQLPPVKAGPEGFSALVQADGAVFDTKAAADRTAQLLAAFDRFAPDILLTEAFPFGRSQMSFELLPLLDRAKARTSQPLIACSVRDILQRNRRPGRIAETLDLVERFYDLVLVHGDPRLAPLQNSFPQARSFETKTIHTGLIAPTAIAPAAGSERYAAVVSAGGGAVAGPLLETALLARPLTRIANHPWLLLTGPNLEPAIAERIARGSDPSLRVEAFVPDLASLLARAEVSISQAGYNTVADVLAAGCRAVVVPFSAGNETEQSDRAALLERRGLSTVVAEPDLTPETLAAAIDRAIDAPRPSRQAIDLDGAKTTARVLRQALRVRQTKTPDRR